MINWQCKLHRVYVGLFASLYLFLSFAGVANQYDDASTEHDETPLQVGVAANFAQPLKKIAELYYTQTGKQVAITVSSSGTLYAQLMHGANFDVFFSADIKRPQALVDVGRISSNDIAVYAQGRLAFLTSDPSMSIEQLDDSTSLNGRFAIANPKLAPYGEAAKQYLENIDKWTLIKPNLVMGKNVLQSYQFFTTGNAKYALVAYSLAKDEHNVTLVPAHLHAPILQGLAITASQQRKAQARQFVHFILSPKIQQRLPEWGYKQAVMQSGEHTSISTADLNISDRSQ